MEVVKILVTVGNANINLSTPTRGTPLHCAAREGKAQIVAYLLMHKADPEYFGWLLRQDPGCRQPKTRRGQHQSEDHHDAREAQRLC